MEYKSAGLIRLDQESANLSRVEWSGSQLTSAESMQSKPTAADLARVDTAKRSRSTADLSRQAKLGERTVQPSAGIKGQPTSAERVGA